MRDATRIAAVVALGLMLGATAYADRARDGSLVALGARPPRRDDGLDPEARRPARRPPPLHVVLRSAADRSSAGRDARTRRWHSDQLRAALVDDLREDRTLVLDAAGARDATIHSLSRTATGSRLEVACEVRIAISDRRGRLISLLSGGARVERPGRGCHLACERALQRDAVENAIEGLHRSLVRFLVSRSRT
jgi:hypothetical protein